MSARAAERLRLETALRHALERGELSLHYQPQIDLRSGDILGMEALLRWSSPELGSIPPSKFIPLAEETDLILPLGEWALREAYTRTRAWHDAGFHQLRVAVNLSARQFHEPGLVDLVDRLVHETGIDPRLLDLELTESLLIQPTNATREKLQKLHAMGIQISIDDFGTGYSSLSYLKGLPIDVLKIDQSFVRDIDSDANDAAIVAAIIALAHNLGMRTIAEGVETRKQLDYLIHHGCDGMQGFYFSKPVPAEEFAKILEGKRSLPASLGRHGKQRPAA